MDIQLTLHGRQDLAGQIYRQLRAGIVDGRLVAGERLPSTRDLASQLGVSRKTTLEVFERLATEGYLRSRAGDGTFVATGVATAPADEPQTNSHQAIPQSIWESVPTALSLPEHGTTRPATRRCGWPSPAMLHSAVPSTAIGRT